ncbi:MAG TPA: cobaltochelatase subunit CobN, partial [Dehalococcoidia bacterium]|nr:cobaltochelatase subunit CobN [Dehalococcoidia bacterium]
MSILFITTAETEVLALDMALRGMSAEGVPPVRAVAARQLTDAATAQNLLTSRPQTRLVLARLLGGKAGLGEEPFHALAGACRDRGIPFLALPGDSQPDAGLAAASTVPSSIASVAFEYLLHGGTANMEHLVRFLADEMLGTSLGYDPPAPLPWDGLYHPDLPSGALLDQHLVRLKPNAPTIGVLFYRAAWMSGDTAAIDAIIRALEARGANVLCAFCYSLKDEDAASTGAPAVVRRYLLDDAGRPRIDALISTLSFSIGNLNVEGATVASGWSVDYLSKLDVPIIQGVLVSSPREQWLASAAGLSPIDAAMKVAMPEFDGHIIGPPVAFREAAEASALGTNVLRLVPDEEGVSVIAEQALAWAKLRQTPNARKRVAIVLANYPTKNARIGNAVGLDSTESVVRLLHA